VNDLVFLYSADSDIQIAYEFYEAVQAGRGDIFMRHLDAGFGQIRAFPELAPVFHDSYRRLLVHGFPYGIFYSLEGGRIIVSAVMDLRQDPNLIRRRLPKLGC
jgi:plasmid stabilization system protein ParE